MSNTSCPLIVFTDLDGCLLDHHSYSYAAAQPALDRLQQANIPVILCSSKTAAEMRPLNEELQVDPVITCENGGMISWNPAGEETVLGASRERILRLLNELKNDYRFQSFQDMGIAGIQEATGLPPEKAERAVQRSCTEPLLWRDDEERIAEFRQKLEQQNLRLTRGGRFWHVSGQTDKGKAMLKVLEQRRKESPLPLHAVALGDSPIDQTMLDVAEHAVRIPSPNGEVRVETTHAQAITATLPGPQGWNECIMALLDRYDVS